MSHLAFLALTLALGLAAFCASGMAQESGIAAKLHPWGRFEPGTWKMVRVVTETLNEQGQVVSTSTTDTKTTLLDVGNDGVTLEVEACMEVAGKRFQVEPQTVKGGIPRRDGRVGRQAQGTGRRPDYDRGAQDPLQDSPVVAVESQRQDEPHPALLDDRAAIRAETRVRRHRRRRQEHRQRDDQRRDRARHARACSGRLRSGSYVRTVHKNGKTTVTTVSVVVHDVPGGVVSHSSKEVDKNGRLLRRSTLELVDYNADPDKDRSGLFGRKRPNRRPKPQNCYWRDNSDSGHRSMACHGAD